MNILYYIVAAIDRDGAVRAVFVAKYIGEIHPSHAALRLEGIAGEIERRGLSDCRVKIYVKQISNLSSQARKELRTERKRS